MAYRPLIWHQAVTRLVITTTGNPMIFVRVGHLALSIDTNSGEVTLLEDPDFETAANITLILLLQSAGNVNEASQ